MNWFNYFYYLNYGYCAVKVVGMDVVSCASVLISHSTAVVMAVPRFIAVFLGCTFLGVVWCVLL